MESGSWSCEPCGKHYTDESHFQRHRNTCPSRLEHTRKSYKLSAALGGLKSVKAFRKRRRISRKSRSDSDDASSAGGRSHDIPSPSADPGNQSEGMNEDAVSDTPAASFDVGDSRDDPGDAQSTLLDYVSMSNASSPPPTSSSPDLAMEQQGIDTLQEKRVRRPSRKIRDSLQDPLPEGPGPLERASSPPAAPLARRVLLRVREKMRTAMNAFGLSREYRAAPTSVPDLDLPLEDLAADRPQEERRTRSIEDIIFPYPNISSFLFNFRHKKGSDKKTKGERDALQDMLLDPRFRAEDLRGVNFNKIDEQIAADVQSPWGENGWKTSHVTIEVPTGIKLTKAVKRQKAKAAQAASRSGVPIPEGHTPVHRFRVRNIHHRSLVHVLQSVVEEDPASKDFHWHPFTETWQPPDIEMPPERVYGELYSSEAFLQAERDMLRTPPEPNCDLPRVVAGLMFWSDATHVAQFGQAKVWPIYAYFGNQSKYTRCKPTCRAAHHVAFVEGLPDDFQDFLRSKGIKPTSHLLAHCRRELFHGTWDLLLDDEFIEAYVHGIVLRCADGIIRRVYLRIFTYSADYPEKVLIATIRDFGDCPCPRCKVRKAQIPGVGTQTDVARRTMDVRHDDNDRRSKIDAARKIIYSEGLAVNSKRVEDHLKDESLVPTVNSFSKNLSRFRFDLFLMLVIDLMHEFELGVWKALLIHLIRMLRFEGEETVNEFNRRFRQIPTFGRSTIRRFVHNVADLKKLAARDFEDILQCCIPCFDGLFHAHNDSIMKLLYLSNYWHSLAKLRLHTDSSLKVLDRVTIAFGQAMRHFQDVICPDFRTVETPAERDARSRAERRRYAKGGQSTADVPKSALRERKFNLVTAKFHFTGDYTNQIRHYGTVDSYNTQIGELEHRVVKKRYGRTSKKNVISQLVKMDVSETVHDRMAEELEAAETAAAADISDTDDGAMPSTEEQLDSHHRIAANESDKVDLARWMWENRKDPAVKDFVPKLRSHILARINGMNAVGDEPEYAQEELNAVHFGRSDCIYRHATATFNYTTYDIRRDQDTINVNTDRRDVMVLSNDDEGDDGASPHPFWYARVLGIYHANIFYRGAHKPQRMEFLWVRWLGLDPEWQGGPATQQLDRVGFVEETDLSGAFGFLDPGQVLRACHLLPVFSLGRTTTLLGDSMVRDAGGDWINYFVNRFVDRDMVMRYLGLGIGHLNGASFAAEVDAIDFPPDETYMAPSDRQATKQNSTSDSGSDSDSSGLDSDSGSDSSTDEEDDVGETEELDGEESGDDDAYDY